MYSKFDLFNVTWSVKRSAVAVKTRTDTQTQTQRDTREKKRLLRIWEGRKFPCSRFRRPREM
jgi:hypothetical protein